MLKSVLLLCSCALLLTPVGALAAPTPDATPGAVRRPWKGHAILGNGTICAVYSDDPRVEAITKARGLQHLYYRDFTADYVTSTRVESSPLSGGAEGGKVAPPTVGRANAFSTLTRTRLGDGTRQDVRCIVHPEGAVLFSVALSRVAAPVSTRLSIDLRARIRTDREINLGALEAKSGGAVARWSNGTVIVVAPLGRARVKTREATVTVTSEMATDGMLDVLVVPAGSESQARAIVARISRQADPFVTATASWEAWMARGRQPAIPAGVPGRDAYLEAFRRNLYAVKAACLGGHIPADITGQFLTNGMPQLYPRDALMCARVFLEAGHLDEARRIVAAWADRGIPRKSRGEYYARYDAHGQAVDAGSGARFDEPEWDAGAYMILLVHELEERSGPSGVDRALVFDLADFLISRLDERGLLYEGGIVEWTGYLPTTNMLACAALRCAASIAEQGDDESRADRYWLAAVRIMDSLPFLFDPARQTYTAVRWHAVKAQGNRSIADRTGTPLRLWDSTFYFGVLWGFPDSLEVRSSDAFHQANTVIMDGGLQYFDASPEQKWLVSYGHDAFFFATAAAAQYHFQRGDAEKARRHVDWMIRNANVYGLMPERIHSDESDCSEASPLSWCCAELAAALLAWR